MTVRIITDSSADIPPSIAEKLDIMVVPQHLVFGDKTYRDRIDITPDEVYDRLLNSKVQPTTSQPSPQEFAKFYKEAGQQADGIVSIHISGKMSGTVRSAENGKQLANLACPVEIIDSQFVALALGIMVIAAARMAKAGKSAGEIADATRSMIPNVRLVTLFDTLEYLARGGRIGKGKALLGSLLNVKPMLMLKEGEFVPVTQVRSRAKGKEKLLEYVRNTRDIEDIGIIYSTGKEEARELAAAIKDFPQERIIVASLGPAVGSHTGPGLLAIAFRTKTGANCDPE
jgi:DegV family protein with EDD domain